MRKIVVSLAASVWLAMAPPSTYAWNRTGHRAIALIAYRQLDEPTRQKVGVLLRKNPAAYDLWGDRKINSDTDPHADAFMNAATFPDDVRPPSRFSKEFHRSTHHYVNFLYNPAEPSRPDVEPRADEENILTSYRDYVATVRSTGRGVTDEARAVALCWIFHQVGDIHMPLHAVARVTGDYPEGDHGGNLVKPFPNPRGSRPWSKSLHAYWDDLLGDDDRVRTFAALEEHVAVLLGEFPRSKFSEAELNREEIRAWALESLDASKKTVYRDLDPAVKGFEDLPVAYEAEAQKLGRRRMVLSAYRLAEVLQDLFGDAND